MLPPIAMMLLGVNFATSTGCRVPDRIQRRSISELYSDAMRDALRRPPPIQPHLLTPPIEHAPSGPVNVKPAVPVEPLPAPVPVGVPLELPLPIPIEEASRLEHIDLSDRTLRGFRRGVIRKASAEEDVDADAAADVPRVSESFAETEIHEALSILASMADVPIVVDDTISGFTSAQITEDTFDQALEKVLLPLGLYYAEKNGTYYIGSQDPDSPLFPLLSVTRNYEPRHHSATALTALLPDRYKYFFRSADHRNLIIVEAPEAIAEDILQRLDQLDAPMPQIILEAIVCVVSPDSGFRFGLDWGHAVDINGLESLNLEMTGLAFSAEASRNGVNNAFQDFAVTSAFVKLLAQEGYVTIRAAPYVTTRDGEKARLNLSRETFFSLQPTSGNVLFRQDVQKVEAGISMEITPHVRGEMISVEIDKAEVSEDIRTNETRSELTSNPYPIINRRLVTTKVDVPNGHTIVIGGLVQRQTVDRINRIPWLGSLPGIGGMFRTVEKQEQDAEVAIFISPRIITSNECFP